MYNRSSIDGPCASCLDLAHLDHLIDFSWTLRSQTYLGEAMTTKQKISRVEFLLQVCRDMTLSVGHLRDELSLDG